MSKPISRFHYKLAALGAMSLFLLAGGCGPSSGSSSSGARIRVEDGAGRINVSSFDTIKIFSLGDSFTSGVSTRSFQNSSPEENWSTGNARYELNSHYQRLESLTAGADVSVFRENYAQAGSKVISQSTKSLNTQAVQVRDQLDRGHFNYVTILMGANDACQSNLSSTEFKSAIKSNMAKAISEFVNDVDLVLLASVPNLTNALTNQACPLNGPELNDALRNLCPNLVDNEVALWEYMDAINQAYSEIASSYPGKVIYDEDAIFKADLNGSMISSVDCYHPNENGQALIAEETWKIVEPYIRGQLNE